MFFTNYFHGYDRKNADHNSRDRDFRLTDQKEMQVFFGLYFY